VGADPLERFVLEQIKKVVVNSSALEAVKKRIRQKLSSERANIRKEKKALEQKLEEIRQKKKVLLENLTPENVSYVNDYLDSLRKEEERIKRELDQMGRTQTGQMKKIMEAANQVLQNLESVGQIAPALVREVVRKFVARLELRFDWVPQGRRRVSRVKEGVLCLRPLPDVLLGDNLPDVPSPPAPISM